MMENAIDELGDDVFLQNSPDDLIETISTNAYLQPLELHPDRAVSLPPIEIPNVYPSSPVPILGYRYSIEMPYTGASGLFNHHPDTADLDKPTAQLRSNSMRGSLFFTRVATTDVPEAELKASFEAEVDKVRKYISFQALQLDPFNASLRDSATKIVHDRRDRLFKARHVAASLGYPLQQRAGAPLTYVSPVVRRKIVRTYQAPSGLSRPSQNRNIRTSCASSRTCHS